MVNGAMQNLDFIVNKMDFPVSELANKKINNNVFIIWDKAF